MSLIQTNKIKSVGKCVNIKGPKLERLVLGTMKTISDLVGSTLGPNGRPVLIERQEYNLPCFTTKDGVTVAKNIGFEDPTAQVVLEASRDAAIRTANDAGDGTTTATILAESLIRLTNQFCKANPRVSPQKIVRRLERAFRDDIEPIIKKHSIKADFSTKKGRKLLKSVAAISANGESELADAVLECFDLVGDGGNVTITEISGPSHYEVEKIEGYPIASGYEESCAKFYPKFINDPGNQRCILPEPVFVLYNGRITEIQTIIDILEKVGQAWQDPQSHFNHNVVVVAVGFSDSVLGQLAINFQDGHTINVLPLLSPHSPIPNGQLNFLEDLAAVTGAKIFDQVSNPLETAELEDLGHGVSSFECYRFRSTVIGHCDAMFIEERLDTLQKQLENNSESVLESTLLQERIGKLTGGIAKLKVIGSSHGELREKRDRAEDAVCAVRGAIEFGCVAGGGWILLKLMNELSQKNDKILNEVLCPALFEPIARLFLNSGYSDEEAIAILKPINEAIVNNSKPLVYDFMTGKHVDAVEGGILDSLPAVLEAIRNSMSIAALLGTLGGTIVFGRDKELERQEARDTNSFLQEAETTVDDRP